MEPVHQAHADLLEQLGKEKPIRIITARGADEEDLVLRDNHLRLVTQAYLRYVKAIVDDTNAHLLAGKQIEMVPVVTGVADVLADYLYSPLQAAASAAASAREWGT
jgi:hypothetical protein